MITVPPKISEIVKRVVALFNPDKIILFGSYATGANRADSDVDLLIVMPITGSKRQKRLEIRVALNGIGIAKDIFLVTPEEFNLYRNQVGTVVRPAATEGKILYERAA